jgi:hypothetical protein
MIRATKAGCDRPFRKELGRKEMHAALYVNIPNYVSVVLTTNEIVASIFDLLSLTVFPDRPARKP